MQIYYEFIKNEKGEDMIGISFDEESTALEKAEAFWRVSAVTSPLFPEMWNLIKQEYPDVHQEMIKLYEFEAPVVDSERIFNER